MIGRVSKSDYPPEGVWLTFSSTQTPFWDLGGAAAGLRENLAAVSTSAELLATPCRAAFDADKCDHFLAHFRLSATELSRIHIGMCINLCVSGHDFKPLY